MKGLTCQMFLPCCIYSLNPLPIFYQMMKPQELLSFLIPSFLSTVPDSLLYIYWATTCVETLWRT